MQASTAFEYEVRASVSIELARKRLIVAIPEAASTRLELDFAGRESDVIIGANEDFGHSDRGPGKGTRLTAHLSPRSKLEVSWLDNPETAAQAPPLLTAQGEIAIEIDAAAVADQVVVVDSLYSGCCAKPSFSLVDENDEITELELDDQSLDDEIDRCEGPGKLLIPLADPLRAGATARLVFRTRRSIREIAFAADLVRGLSVLVCRASSRDYIGITKSPDVWICSGGAAGIASDRSRASCRATCGRGRQPAWPTSFPISRSRWIWRSNRLRRRFGGKRGHRWKSPPIRCAGQTTIDLAWVGEALRDRAGRRGGPGSGLGGAERSGREHSLGRSRRRSGSRRIEKTRSPALDPAEPASPRQK